MSVPSAIPAPHDGFSDTDRALLALARTLQEGGYRFTTVTPLTQARVNARPENAWATDLAGVFGWSQPFKSELLAAPLLALMRDADVLEPIEGGFRSRVRVSTLGDLFFLHSAYPTTAADSVFFGPDTVRFVGAIRRHLQARTAPVRRAADIGCGAGPGGIAVAAAEPGADVDMVDINGRALRFARVNAALNGVRAQVFRSDVLADTTGDFDLIVSNPPYLIDRDKRAYRHGGGQLGEGLALTILQQSLARLAPGGSLVLYTGSAIAGGHDLFAAKCRECLDARGCRWSYAELDPDVFGEELETPPYRNADRIAAVVLTVTNERQ